jgi:hypothetical protein
VDALGRQRPRLHLRERAQRRLLHAQARHRGDGAVRRAAPGDQHGAGAAVPHPGQRRADRRLEADRAGGEVGEQLLRREIGDGGLAPHRHVVEQHVDRAELLDEGRDRDAQRPRVTGVGAGPLDARDGLPQLGAELGEGALAAADQADGIALAAEAAGGGGGDAGTGTDDEQVARRGHGAPVPGRGSGVLRG